MITRLADILVIQAIRAWIESDPAARTGWLGALRDAQIGRAIALIHRDPARDWTVASLAARWPCPARPSPRASPSWSASRRCTTSPAGACTSRSTAPEEGVTVGELAGRLGYRSEAAFSRAFKRFIGVPPGSIRRAA